MLTNRRLWVLFNSLEQLCLSSGIYRRVVRYTNSTLRFNCDGTRAETIFRLSAKRTSPFQSAGASVQSTTGSRGVRISGSNAGYTTFRGNVNSTGYPLHSPVSSSLPLSCVTVCHQVSTGLCHTTGHPVLKRLSSWQMM